MFNAKENIKQLSSSSLDVDMEIEIEFEAAKQISRVQARVQRLQVSSEEYSVHKAAVRRIIKEAESGKEDQSK